VARLDRRAPIIGLAGDSGIHRDDAFL